MVKCKVGLAKKPTFAFYINRTGTDCKSLELEMDFLSTSDCLYDRRHSIISPEPIKTAYSALAEARFACDYSLSENNASRYTNPDRHHCEVSIESETYNYSNDL